MKNAYDAAIVGAGPNGLMASVSPAYRGRQLDRFGLHWASGPALLAHPFDHGPAALLERSMTNAAHRSARMGERG